MKCVIPKDFIQKLIVRSGPIISATRPLIYDKKKKCYVKGEIRGSITNYDRRTRHFKGDKQHKSVIEFEKARWHYFKSFEQYGFTADEWR